jgi:FtsZ-interacting cell division protein ZipA
MSTGVIIVIVVVAVIIVAALLLALSPMRERARVRRRERELQQRRVRVAGEHRQEAQVREQRAAVADRRARIAESEAQRERAEAQLHEERAALHEEGLADPELVQDHERERFAGTSAVREDDTHLDEVPDTSGAANGDRATTGEGEYAGTDPRRGAPRETSDSTGASDSNL